MKALYYASKLLSAPFYLVAWALYGLSWAVNWVGDEIHDKTEYRAWLVLHKRACDRSNIKGSHAEK